MNVVIAGGGMVGLTLARLLRVRGFDPIVIERMPEGAYLPRGYMLGFQGYAPLEEAGILDEIRPQGWPIAPRPDQPPVAICIEVGKVLHALARDVNVEYGHEVTELVRDPDGRVVGVVATPTTASGGPDAATQPSGGYGEVTGGPGVATEAPSKTIPADLVVACDGMGSPVRTMAGFEAKFEPLAEAFLGFYSPEPGAVSFAMAYLSNGGHIGTLGWPEGSAGWRSIPKVGAEAALAPGVEAVQEMWSRLLPESAKGVGGVTSIDQVRYSEPALLTCPEWWKPGILLIGDSAHFFGPETGISSGIGLGDAHALAEAIRQYPDDSDAACQSFITWRSPVVRPYEAMDPARHRMRPGDVGPLKPEEDWPPAG